MSERITYMALLCFCATMNQYVYGLDETTAWCETTPTGIRPEHFIVIPMPGGKGYTLDRTGGRFGVGTELVLARGTSTNMYEAMHAWLEGYRAAASDSVARYFPPRRVGGAL